MHSRKQDTAEDCANEKKRLAKLGKMEGLPRNLENFWNMNRLPPPAKLSGHSRLMRNIYNKSLGFTHRERQLLNIHGLMPVVVKTMEQQIEECQNYYRNLSSDFAKYIYLTDLEFNNRTLFFGLMRSNPHLYMSMFQCSETDFLIKNYSIIYTVIRAMFVTIKDRGHIYNMLKNWPQRQLVHCVMITNGASVLSLGDCGVNGTPVLIYKILSNVVYGNMNPDFVLPIVLDAGTDNEKLLQEPYYVGLRQSRVKGQEFEDFFEEFTLAILRLYGPRTIIQAKDFGPAEAMQHLDMYRNRQCFMDVDLQVMGACGLAGVLSANKITQKKFQDNTFLFHGVESFNLGMARMCLAYFKRCGLDETSGKGRIYLCDDHGLIVHGRCDHKVPQHLQEFRQRHAPIESLVDIIDKFKPNVLVGCSRQHRAFTKDVLRALERCAQQPIIFAMSTPSEHAECTAEDAFVYTKGRCIYISAFEQQPLKYANKWYQPPYCSCTYILSGLTLGIILSGMTTVPDETFLVVAERLSNLVWPNDLAKRYVYPPIRKLNCIQIQIADAVFTYAYRRRLATLWPEPENSTSYIKSMLYKPEYKEVTEKIYCTTDRMIGTTESKKYYKQKI